MDDMRLSLNVFRKYPRVFAYDVCVGGTTTWVKDGKRGQKCFFQLEDDCESVRYEVSVMCSAGDSTECVCV